jgi:glycogen debranching enzyme
MAAELNVAADPEWAVKAAALRRNINDRFWMPEAGRYRYLVDGFGGSDHQEGLGHSFAILLGVADADSAARVLRNQHVTDQGIACVWPTFPRYQRAGQDHFGRHSGTVWPHVQGFWALAALAGGRGDLFEFEFRKLAELACRSGEFREIYHPVTGEAYGGLQEGYRKGQVTPSRHRQTWSATAFMGMVIRGLFGMEFRPEGIRFRPAPLAGVKHARLGRLRYRKADLQVRLDLGGSTVKSFRTNGIELAEPVLPAGTEGPVDIEVVTA